MADSGIGLAALLVGAIGLMILVLAFIWPKPVRGLYLAFFACGILITPHLPVVREKFTATELIVLLTWLTMLLHARAWRNPSRPLRAVQHKVIQIGAAFIFWVVLSLLINSLGYVGELTASLVETFNYLYGFLIFCTVLLLVDDWEKWFGCLTAWFLGAVVVSLVGVWALTGSAPAWTMDENTHRISSTLRTENQVPAFLLPILAAAVFAAARRGVGAFRRWGLMALLVGMLLTAIGTGSRTALLMAGLCIAGVWFLATKGTGRRALNQGLLSGLALGLVVGVVAYFTIALASYDGEYSLIKTPPWQRPAVLLTEWWQGERAIDNTRPEQLNRVRDASLDYLVFGTGPKLAGPKLMIEEIHNTYASLLIEVGLPGLVLFLFWLVSVLRIGWRSGHLCPDPYQRIMVLSLVMGLVVLMLYSMTMFGLRQRNIWLIAGLLVAVPRLLGAARPRQQAALPAWLARGKSAESTVMRPLEN